MTEKEQLEDIKNNLSLNQIETLLFNLGGEPYRQEGIIISRTICHSGSSHKLYYYENTHLFRCFTDCGDTFDIFQLIIKIFHEVGKEISLPQAKDFIIKFFNITVGKKEDEFDFFLETEDWKIIQKYNGIKEERQQKQIDLKIYDNKILTFLPKPHILSWEKEGIKKEVCDYHNICYNPSSQAIVIPHYDKDNNLIGIRERTLIKENEVYGKYRPAYINKQMYNHPLGFALYNLNNSKDNIKKMKKVIIFERRKVSFIIFKLFWKRK